MAEHANSIESNKYLIEFSWASDEIPVQYLSTNRNTYEPFTDGSQ